MTALLDPPTDVSDASARVAAPAIAPPAPEPSALTLVVRRGLLLLAIFTVGCLAYVFLLSSLTHARAQTGLERRFESQLEQGVAPVNQPVEVGSPVAVLEIPEIGLHEIVVEGSTSTQLAKGPGHLRTTALPGQPGTSIVLCRRAAFAGPCADLDQLEAGDTISVTNGQGAIEFEVVETITYAGDDARAFAGRGSSLVLVTMDEAVFGTGRLVVVAEPLGQQVRGARMPAAPLQADELGLAGDRDAASRLLVWLEVLALCAIGAVVLFRRWNRWSAYVVIVPPLLAATWLVYEQIGRLLPGVL
jgi:sortase A